MNIASHLRHQLSFLGALGTIFLGWSLIPADQVEAVNKAGAELIAPCIVIIGAVGVGLSRLAMARLGQIFNRKVDSLADKASGGMSGGALLLIMGTTAASIVGVLPSCSSFSGSVTYRDPATGAEGGVVFKPGKKPVGTLTVPVRDPETGEVTGSVDLASGK